MTATRQLALLLVTPEASERIADGSRQVGVVLGAR
jgi:hypothetical protein